MDSAPSGRPWRSTNRPGGTAGSQITLTSGGPYPASRASCAVTASAYTSAALAATRPMSIRSASES